MIHLGSDLAGLQQQGSRHIVRLIRWTLKEIWGAVKELLHEDQIEKVAQEISKACQKQEYKVPWCPITQSRYRWKSGGNTEPPDNLKAYREKKSSTGGVCFGPSLKFTIAVWGKNFHNLKRKGPWFTWPIIGWYRWCLLLIASPNWLSLSIFEPGLFIVYHDHFPIHVGHSEQSWNSIGYH